MEPNKVATDICDVLALGGEVGFKGDVVHARPTTATPLDDAMSSCTEFFGTYTGKTPEVCLSGIPPVDAELGGIMPGSLSVIAARTKEGKTSISLWFALNAASRKKHAVGYIPLEDEYPLIGGKIISYLARVDDVRIQTGRCADDEKSRITAAHERARNIPLFVSKVEGLGLDDVERYVADLADSGCKTIFIDYLHTIGKPEAAAASETAAIGIILNRLHMCARKHNVALVIIAQLNRPQMVKNKETNQYEADLSQPSVHTIRGSAEIANKARLVVVCWREFGITHAKVAYSSRGAVEGATIRFERDRNGLFKRIV